MKNANLPAMPCSYGPNDDGDHGMTKKEYFACIIMQGLCANSNHNGIYKDTAIDALRFSDALLSELEKEQ